MHVYTCQSPVPSLGRRQSQCWGCSPAAPVASQAYLGGESTSILACKSEGPQREAAQPCNLYWIYSFPIYRPHTPHREEVSTALSLSPKTICYDTHMSTHNRVNTHMQTLSGTHILYLVYLRGTLPHSKEVITAHFQSLWELCRGQAILRFVIDRKQTGRENHPNQWHNELFEAGHCLSYGEHCLDV